MSKINFEIGKPRKMTLSFDKPKPGTNEYGPWYMYGFKPDINSDEDCFFATPTLHDMIQTLGAKEGDEITIEKCPPEEGMEYPYFKVNGLTRNDIKEGKSVEANKQPTTEDRPATISEDDIPF